MRAVTGFLVGIIAALVALSLGVIVVQNSVSVDVIFLGATYQAPTGWLLLIFSAVGFVVAFLLLIPGRLASAWRSWALSKQTHRLQDKLVDVQTQYALLEGELRLLRAERQQRTGGALGSGMPSATGSGNSAQPRMGSADQSRVAGAPVPAAVGVAVAERPVAPVVAPAATLRKSTAGERLRIRVAMLRGRLKARVQRLRKRFTRRSDKGAASARQRDTGTPAR